MRASPARDDAADPDLAPADHTLRCSHQQQQLPLQRPPTSSSPIASTPGADYAASPAVAGDKDRMMSRDDDGDGSNSSLASPTDATATSSPDASIDPHASSQPPSTTAMPTAAATQRASGVKRAALATDALDAPPTGEKRAKCADAARATDTPPATTASSAFFRSVAAAAAHPASQPTAAPRKPARVLSPLALASADEVRQHVRDVRREVFLRPLLAVVTRLMFHKLNHGLFNVRVDPVAWNIPHYLEVVKRPMDLSVVKNRCLNLEYASADECAADVRLVFANARLFNPPGHAVHEAARLLLDEFEREFARFAAKARAREQKRAAHSCASCLANECAVCGHKCVTLEPPLVVCAGACRQRIKRHALCYSTRERSHHWCAKCFSALPKLLSLAPAPGDETAAEVQVPKASLVKAKFLDELTEPWVQCDRCDRWVHQVCALFNAREDAGDAPFACPLCRVDELARAEQDWDVEMSPPSETSVDEFPLQLKLELMGSHSPVLKRKPSAKDFTRVLGFDSVIEEKVFDFLGGPGAAAAAASPAAVASSVVSSSSVDSPSQSQSQATPSSPPPLGAVSSRQLRSCALSRFMQTWVRERLEQLGEHAAARSIVIKVVSSIKTACQVSPAVREHFRSATQSYPASIDFTSKAIFVFQKINGIEVCIFSMYVQEYDGSASVAANRQRTYIAYIDSLVYMRPRHVRTRLFHETLIAYLAFCKARGFEHAHIWACPTTRGGDFIYWCHPSFQKNPGKDRLLQWYLQMADVGRRADVVFACHDLYAREFEQLEARLESRLPPYFDGDYWPAEAERLAARPPKRGRLSREAYAASLRGENFRRRIVESVKASRESLFVIALQPACAACGAMIVNRACWKRGDEYACAECHAAQDPAAPPMERVAPPSFVERATSSGGGEDDGEIRCAFLDHRPDMLKHCEEQHYQFDSFRRAKYSTMMLLYQISSAQQQQQEQEQAQQQQQQAT